MEQKSTPIDVQLDSLRRKKIQENREKLRPIVDAIILCGRQNIAFRGHRDDSKYLDCDDVNAGNFLEILKYGSKCANIPLQEFLHKGPRNATYRSKTTQNQLIEICGELVTSKIVAEVKLAKLFSILVLADEATDCANIEQMSLAVRFVDKDCLIREEFLGFVPCKLGLSGEAVANTILNSLHELDLPIDNCRGQGYDRAGNMAGRLSRAAARITTRQSMMDTVRVVTEFFRTSPKRSALLRKTMEEIHPKPRHETLIDVCKTRWVSRIDGLGVFIETFAAIVQTLEEIRDNLERH